MQDPPQVSPLETQTILEFAREQLKIPGAYVEFGCYRGDTSLKLQKLLVTSQNKIPSDISALSRQRHDKTPAPGTHSLPKNLPRHRLYLYDSFAGLPRKTSADLSPAGDYFLPGALSVTKKTVVTRFKKANLPVPNIKKAFFDELTSVDLPAEISFAFLDGDLYLSIKTSLQLVYPRLHQQGIVLVHDYNNPKLPGPARAVDEFLTKNLHLRLSVYQTLAILSAS